MKNPSVDVIVIKLDGYFGISVTNKEFEVKVSSNHLICDFVIFLIIDEHAVSISEEDDMEIMGISISSEVHWMSSVDLLARVSIINASCISCPDRIPSRI